jgi:SAM-dependent methyltransferase
MVSDNGSYLLAGQPAELARLQVQSRVWEPAGRALLKALPGGTARSAVDVGCGVMGWLRVLSEWAGADGRVVGSDVDDRMLVHARSFVDAKLLHNVSLVKDDLFTSGLPPASFDLVHARFQIAPLGRAAEQLAVYRRLARPGGWIVLEDPDLASWRVNPDAPAVQKLIGLIEEGFRLAGGNFNSGRQLPALLEGIGLRTKVVAHVVALPADHPYLRLPLQFAASLRPRLEVLVGARPLDDLLRDAEQELSRQDVWGTTFTLIQAAAAVPP